MAKKLLIVESPTKAKTIGKYLGEGFEVVATVGHIRDLPKSKLGIDLVKDFEIEYEIDSEKKAVVAKLRSAALRADEIILATDPDREGEAIAWHVKWVMEHDDKLPSSSAGKQVTSDKSDKKQKLEKKLPKKVIRRVTFHEITKEAVNEAIKAPREIDDNLVDAQQGRRVLDRVVGYKISPVLWKKVRRNLSAGRVQSVAVRLIAEREREIEKFMVEKYFGWRIKLIKSDQVFEVGWRKWLGERVWQKTKIDLFDGEYSYQKTIFDQREKVEKSGDLIGSELVVTKVEARDIKRQPLPPLTTSKLQQIAARRFGWSGKQTMRVAQKLYEQGLITYHRTDSYFVSSKAIGEIRDWVGKTWGENYLPASPRFYKQKSKNSQEAHEAIRPTAVVRLELGGEVDVREKKLYEMIWRRTVACQMAPAVLAKTVVDLESGGGEFRAEGMMIRFDGFLRTGEGHGEEQDLPKMAVGDKVKIKEKVVEEMTTRPPPRYSEASLVSSLEKQGIGRPSTYAPIISTIQLRQYVEKEEGRFRPTSLGLAVNDFLVTNFGKIVSLPFTAMMELGLDKIAAGEGSWKGMMREFWQELEPEIARVEKDAERVKVEVEKIGEKCPECKEGDLVIRVGRFGKFISCDRFPECKYHRAFKEAAGFVCPQCGGEGVVRRTKKGRRFYGCGNYPKCKWAAWKKP